MPRRIKALIVLCAMGGVGIFVSLAFIGGNRTECTTPEPIEELRPGCNDAVLAQASVGVMMATGYRAELLINGTPIPLDEITTEVGEGNIAGAAPQVFTFQPGPGQTFEQLQPGRNSATVRYWRVTETIDEASQFTWFFEAA